VFPHHAKKHKGGEDAFFLSNSFIAVADGVGGWAESGVDPAIYSRNLCENIGKVVQSHEKDLYNKKPREALIRAVERTKDMGSCTCVLASIDPEAPYLYTANLGDSGFVVLRKEGLDLVSVY